MSLSMTHDSWNWLFFIYRFCFTGCIVLLSCRLRLPIAVLANSWQLLLWPLLVSTPPIHTSLQPRHASPPSLLRMPGASHTIVCLFFSWCIALLSSLSAIWCLVSFAYFVVQEQHGACWCWIWRHGVPPISRATRFEEEIAPYWFGDAFRRTIIFYSLPGLPLLKFSWSYEDSGSQLICRYDWAARKSFTTWLPFMVKYCYGI